MTEHRRILITGGPRTGKTTLAIKLENELGIPARHTDDLIGLHKWSETSDVVATWFDDQGPLLIEGVAAIRALRKWVKANREGLPIDVLYLGADPKMKLTPQQLAMTRGCMTVWNEIAVDVLRRGLPVKSF